MTRPIARRASSPGYADSVNGRVPTFIVHRSHFDSGLLADAVTRAQRGAGLNAAVSVAVRLPRTASGSAKTFLDNNSHATLRIADPEIFTLAGSNPAPWSSVPGKADQYEYAKNTVPTTPNAAWVRQVHDAQHDAGANVLLSASGWVGASGLAQLDQALAFVAESRAQLGADDVMFANLTLHHSWLANTTYRDHLLQHIVESNELRWWIRVMWPPLSPGNYSQLRSEQVVDGYKELAEVASDEKKVLFLPNSGLTGWYATALGASGYSTGMSGPERAYEDKAPPGPMGNIVPKQRYFDRTVLHTILRTDHMPLRGQPGHTRCGCAYCRELDSGSWTQKIETLHYLLQCAQLTAELGAAGPAGRRSAAYKLVATAKAFADGLPARVALTGESKPSHLALWEDRLA